MKHVASYKLFKDLLKQQLVQKPVRLLGLHVGAKHVGVAVADLDIARAEPYCVMRRKDTNSIAQSFQRLIREESVMGIIVGVPIEEEVDNPQDSPNVTQVKVFFEELAKTAKLNDVSYALLEDSLTPSQNVEYLLAPFHLDPVARKKITENVFERSATAFLQDYADKVRQLSYVKPEFCRYHRLVLPLPLPTLCAATAVIVSAVCQANDHGFGGVGGFHALDLYEYFKQLDLFLMVKQDAMCKGTKPSLLIGFHNHTLMFAFGRFHC
ncbi:putative pre-16S rRNA nuclease isoform X2 [Tanacetum coccineum]